ncbi:hypothetical protein WJX73_002094 [Symbiochloris irregularis]|uniref:Lysosomal Pro-X carboxypeptidase n=1 Tax=Symbiochloris irregularis TaxID=706552 RepID=A0AAW1P0D2_9CHLO
MDTYKSFVATPEDNANSLYPNGDLISQCKVFYRNATLDHFSWGPTANGETHFRQRYFVCDKHWRHRGPIFFYLGNEADVTLYLNNSGLMWENAPRFGALLVFAEHRYYGESKPFVKCKDHMQYLTSEQALADYANLITILKVELDAEHSPVIGFGGSYGGMLAAWMRFKYPHILNGAIAGSAPIWTYLGENPAYDPGSFAKIVTYDASPEAGSAANCIPNAQKAWQALFDLGESQDGRTQIRKHMRLCDHAPMNGPADAAALVEWAGSAWDYLAMGNFPYPSPYILNGAGLLPTFPVRVACSHLAGDFGSDEALLSGMADAIGVFYNYSGSNTTCYDFAAAVNPETDEDGTFWDYQYCTENTMPFAKNGAPDDMFWSAPFDKKGTEEACQARWGVTPRWYWPNVEWGGRNLETLTNVVFSNGLYDPWHGGGVLRNLSDSVVAVIIPDGAHHLDLMFSNPQDTPSVKAARRTELWHIQKWINEAEKLRPWP